MTYTHPKYPTDIPTLSDFPTLYPFTSLVKADDINALKDELFAVMNELGTNPSGAYSSVASLLTNMLPQTMATNSNVMFENLTVNNWMSVGKSFAAGKPASDMVFELETVNEHEPTYVILWNYYHPSSGNDFFFFGITDDQICDIGALFTTVLRFSTSNSIQWYIDTNGDWIPYSTGVTNIGSDSKYCDNIYADDFINKSVYKNTDKLDLFNILRKISRKVKVDVNGEKIDVVDTASLPDFIQAKKRKVNGKKEHLGKYYKDGKLVSEKLEPFNQKKLEKEKDLTFKVDYEGYEDTGFSVNRLALLLVDVNKKLVDEIESLKSRVVALESVKHGAIK